MNEERNMTLKKWIYGVACGCLSATLLIAPAAAQIRIGSSEGDASLTLGVTGQIWSDFQQDANTTAPQGYQQDIFIRRIRFMMGGSLTDNLTFFLQTDDPNLGKLPKSLGTGFIIQDAFFEYRISDAVRVDGGEMIVPLTRNAMQSVASYFTLDISPVATQNNTATQSNALRDLGFQLRGFFLKDHLGYRLGEFSGERDSNGRDSLRTAGFLQYDFFSPETGYTFVGTALGKQKILALNAGFDTQGSYHAFSSDLAAAIPVRGGDEIGGQVQFVRYQGGEKFLTIPQQNDVLVEAAYYTRKYKVQPFAKFEDQEFTAAPNALKDWDKWGGGLNYYLHGQNLKLTLQLQRAFPQNSPNKPSNEFSIQFQVFYF
jgi:hypothetical protein